MPKSTDQKAPTPGRMVTSRYTSSEYLIANPDWHVGDSPWKASQVLRMLRRNDLEPRSVCEIGCGPGEILRQLQSSLPRTRFVGYDIAPEAIKMAQARANESLTFRCEDLLEVDSEPFDLLLCIDVMEHVPDYLGFLRRLVAKAHRSMFHVPLQLSAESVIRASELIRSREALGHLHYFSKETAIASFEDVGFEVIDWFYTPTHLRSTRPSWKSRLLKGPRSIAFAMSRDFAVRLLGGYSLLALCESRNSLSDEVPT